MTLCLTMIKHLPMNTLFSSTIILISMLVGRLPPHKLTLKKGRPLMLLGNSEPKIGLCNGTRLLCRDHYNDLLDCEILPNQFVRSRLSY